MSESPVAAAHHCLEKACVFAFPVSLGSVLRSLKIGCTSFTDIAKEVNCQLGDVIVSLGSREGTTQVKGSKLTIAYNDNQPFARIRFTIAHELGHIVMRHKDEMDKPYGFKENEANDFARNLLAPPAAVEAWESPNGQFRLKYAGWYFGISKACAFNRFKYLNEDISSLKLAGLYDAQREKFEPFLRENPLGERTGNKCLSNKTKSCGVYLPEGMRTCPLCGSVTIGFLESLVRPLDEFMKHQSRPVF